MKKRLLSGAASFLFLSCRQEGIIGKVKIFRKQVMAMAMNFDIPDISETAGKAVTGGKKRKTRKIGALRLGDSLRMIANHFTCTEESRDEDKNIAFYSLSDGEEKASFYGEEISLTGVCIYRKKTAAIYAELRAEK